MLRGRRAQKGDAIVEGMISLMLLCLILFGLLQIVYLSVAQMFTQYSAYKAARAYTVGFADHIVELVGHTAVAGASGELLNPPIAYDNQVEQAAREVFPLPRMSPYDPSTRGLLTQYQSWGNDSWVQYKYWGNGGDAKTFFHASADASNGDMTTGHARFQNYPVDFPMARAFFPDGYQDIAWPMDNGDYASLHDFSRDFMD